MSVQHLNDGVSQDPDHKCGYGKLYGGAGEGFVLLPNGDQTSISRENGSGVGIINGSLRGTRSIPFGGNGAGHGHEIMLVRYGMGR